MREYCYITITDDCVITKSKKEINDPLETYIQFYANDMDLDLILRVLRGAYRQTVLSDKRRRYGSYPQISNTHRR